MSSWSKSRNTFNSYEKYNNSVKSQLIYHMPRQFSCPDVCKFATWFNHQTPNQNKQNFHSIYEIAPSTWYFLNVGVYISMMPMAYYSYINGCPQDTHTRGRTSHAEPIRIARGRLGARLFLLLTHCGRVTHYGDGCMLCKSPIFFNMK